MSILHEEKGQGSTEVLLVLGLAVAAAITVGFYLKNFVTQEIQPEVENKT
ncbi:MAG TPA: hypothetical protein HA254_06285 [Candidatus Diapherotrites archaeon]|uniref:Class III signal peptide-containing protein n=1 Tax=Candidatus Iainarchaeum sp. TaxID=3101447 RepID=A0A7J4IXF7_9ARCH|nr:hypothetical protein [Candidatus Diapherotrites archaeon]